MSSSGESRPGPGRASRIRSTLRGTGGLWILLAAVLLIDGIGFRWALPHTVAPHPDDVAKPALEAVQHKFLEPTKYGKVHLLTLAAAYAPYFGWMVLTGDLDLSKVGSGANAGAFADPVGSTVRLLEIARGVSLLLHLGGVLLIYFTVLRWGRVRVAAWFAAALWGFAPTIAFFARSSNVDLPLAFWGSVSAWCASRVLEESTRRRMIAFCVAVILTVCTKEQAAFALAPVCLVVGLRFWMRHPRGLGGCLVDLSWGLGIAALIYAALNDLLWNPRQYFDRLDQWGSDLDYFEQKTAPDKSALDLVVEGAVAFLHVGGPGLALLAVLAALRALRRPDGASLLLVVCALSAGASVTAYLGYVQPRFFFPSALFAVYLVGRQISEFWPPASPRARRWASGVLGLALASTLAHGLMVAWALTEEPRTPALRWVEQNVRRAADGETGGAGHRSPVASEAEVYQNFNLLPGVSALGVEFRREGAMNRKAFERRRPALVLVADNFRWMWRARQRDFVDWLESGPEGYTLARFGPRQHGREPWFMAEGPASRIWPNVTVLVRDDVLRESTGR